MTDTIRIIPPKGFDYINTGNPSATTNPPTALVTWLNATTGVIWVCTDNTTDANVWMGQGIAHTELETFTPSVSNSTNITFTGRKCRYGHFLYIEVFGAISGACTNNSKEITLPDGLAVASALLGAGPFEQHFNSDVRYMDATDGKTYIGKLVVGTTPNVIRFAYLPGDPPYAGSAVLQAGYPMAGASGDQISASGFIPISGWTVQDIIS